MAMPKEDSYFDNSYKIGDIVNSRSSQRSVYNENPASSHIRQLSTEDRLSSSSQGTQVSGSASRRINDGSRREEYLLSLREMLDQSLDSYINLDTNERMGKLFESVKPVSKDTVELSDPEDDLPSDQKAGSPSPRDDINEGGRRAAGRNVNNDKAFSRDRTDLTPEKNELSARQKDVEIPDTRVKKDRTDRNRMGELSRENQSPPQEAKEEGTSSPEPARMPDKIKDDDFIPLLKGILKYYTEESDESSPSFQNPRRSSFDGKGLIENLKGMGDEKDPSNEAGMGYQDYSQGSVEDKDLSPAESDRDRDTIKSHGHRVGDEDAIRGRRAEGHHGHHLQESTEQGGDGRTGSHRAGVSGSPAGKPEHHRGRLKESAEGSPEDNRGLTHRDAGDHTVPETQIQNVESGRGNSRYQGRHAEMRDGGGARDIGAAQHRDAGDGDEDIRKNPGSRENDIRPAGIREGNIGNEKGEKINSRPWNGNDRYEVMDLDADELNNDLHKEDAAGRVDFGRAWIPQTGSAFLDAHRPGAPLEDDSLRRPHMIEDSNDSKLNDFLKKFDYLFNEKDSHDNERAGSEVNRAFRGDEESRPSAYRDSAAANEEPREVRDEGGSQSGVEGRHHGHHHGYHHGHHNGHHHGHHHGHEEAEAPRYVDEDERGPRERHRHHHHHQEEELPYFRRNDDIGLNNITANNYELLKATNADDTQTAPGETNAPEAAENTGDGPQAPQEPAYSSQAPQEPAYSSQIPTNRVMDHRLPRNRLTRRRLPRKRLIQRRLPRKRLIQRRLLKRQVMSHMLSPTIKKFYPTSTVISTTMTMMALTQIMALKGSTMEMVMCGIRRTCFLMKRNHHWNR